MSKMSKKDFTDFIKSVREENGSFRIDRISISNLFGYLDYNLHKKDDRGMSDSPLSIIYGDNGSGKTTILKLIYHALSPKRNRRHRSSIMDIPFQSFVIYIKNLENSKEIEITFSRGKKNTKADAYQISVKESNNELIILQAEVNHETAKADYNSEDIHRYTLLLEVINLPIYYLSSDRIIHSDSESNDDKEHLSYIYDLLDENRVTGGLISRSKRAANKNQDLESVLNSTYQWVVQQSFLATNAGTSLNEEIYIEIVNRISHDSKNKSIKKYSRKDMILDLKELAEENKEMSKLGIVPDFISPSLVLSISQTPPEKIDILSEILNPYIEIAKNRIETLRPIYRSTSNFIDGLNSMFHDKSISFVADKGLVIRNNRTENLINPNDLSSGEQQLLRLFCHTLTSANFNSIFMIDEPEISLNIKWQRRLISSLLNMSGENKTQYIIATHSIEVLSQYLEEVVKIEDKNA